MPQDRIRKITGAPFANDRSPLGTFTFTVQPNSLAGDFNLDGVVDGADASVWQSDYGNFADGSALVVDGDANGDGHVNGSDFLLWQRNFGQSLPEAAASISIPESRSMALLLTGVMVSLAANLRRS